MGVAAAPSAPLTLSADTDLDVLMGALLGTSASARARESRPADVESRLAEVLADVGLSVGTGRTADVARARGEPAEAPASLSAAGATTERVHRQVDPPVFSRSRAAASPRRWLWFALPVLLAVAIVGWMSGARVTDGQSGGVGRAPQTTSAK